VATGSDRIELATAKPDIETAIYALLADISHAGAGLAGALQAFAAGGAPVQWTPQVSGLLNEILPANLLSIERGFAEILQRADALAQNVAQATVQNSFATRMTVTSLLIAGALLLRHPGKARGRLVLTNNANSSWSWVLGTSAKK
jgi:hypothetical protein